MSCICQRCQTTSLYVSFQVASFRPSSSSATIDQVDQNGISEEPAFCLYVTLASPRELDGSSETVLK